MTTLLKHIWNDRRGALTFEWILVITLLVIGIVGGYSAVRDGLIDELGDVTGAILAVDQSFTTEGPECAPECDWGSYTDEPAEVERGRPDEPPVSQ
ncbi:MAG: Flp family type IVb pilin [Planctomycetota bacterium]